MRFADQIRTVLKRARAFLGNRDANIAMMFGLSLIPVTIAAGAGLDLTRAMIVRSNLTEALDAAALAAGSQPSLSQDAMRVVAQNYFNANYKAFSGGIEPSNPAADRSYDAGAIVGLAAVGLLSGVPPIVAAAVAVLFGVLLTGAFHEDGLADVADAFAGGWTREQRIKILVHDRHGREVTRGVS